MQDRYLVKDLLLEMTKILGDIERAPREAQLLLMAFLNVDELWLITNQKKELLAMDELFGWAKRRAKHEPLEYITKSVSFYSEVFYIDEGALIPRPETELLIDEVIKRVEDKETRFRFVEVGVGSGIISIILAKYFPKAKFIAVDISQKALKVAEKNIERFGLQKRIELRLGSLLEPINEDIDYLVSNPPYIENGVVLESNLSYEPQNALFGGEVGDELIKKLLDEVLKQRIKFFSCEMGYDQQSKIQDYLNKADFKSLSFYKDYSNFDRGFTLEL